MTLRRVESKIGGSQSFQFDSKTLVELVPLLGWQSWDIAGIMLEL